MSPEPTLQDPAPDFGVPDDDFADLAAREAAGFYDDVIYDPFFAGYVCGYSDLLGQLGVILRDD